MNQPSKGKLVLYVVSLFLVGAITGSALTYSIVGKRHGRGDHPPRGMTEHMRADLKTKLGLTEEQSKKIDPMIDKAGAELQGIQTNTMQRVSQVIESLHAQMRPELTAEQKTKLEEMEKEFRERRNRFRRSDGPSASPSKTNSVSK
jgi:Na+/phosphate symporter